MLCLCPLLLGQLLRQLLLGQFTRPLLLGQLLHTLLFDLPSKPALRFLTRQRRIAFALLLGHPLLGQGALTRLFTLLLPHQFVLDRSALPG